MAKETGLGMSLMVDDSGGTSRDLSNDVMSMNWSTPLNLLDVTGLNESAHERLAGLADFSITASGTFNDAANQSHQVFRDINAGDPRTVAIAISGQSLTCETLFSDYALTRGADGSLNWSAPGMLSNGAVPVWA